MKTYTTPFDEQDLWNIGHGTALQFTFACKCGTNTLRIAARTKLNLVNKWPSLLYHVTGILYSLTGDGSHEIELESITVLEEK